jgi:hypothetical protein
MLIYESAEQQSEGGEFCPLDFAAIFVDCFGGFASSPTVGMTMPSTCDGA